MRLSQPFVARAVVAIAILAVSGIAAARADDASLSPAQQDAVRKIVHDYLAEHPEAIVDAIQTLRERDQAAARDATKKMMVERHKELYEDPNSQVFGNPNGDVTIVEFFDYHCPYCKAMTDSVLDIVHSDGKVRLVMKELPILGSDSVFAAHAAIASRNQNLYPQFHTALMHLKGPLSEAIVMQTAASVGLDVDKLKKDMRGSEVDAIINANMALARALNVDGTPGWVAADKLNSGAMSSEAFEQMIDDARKSKS